VGTTHLLKQALIAFALLTALGGAADAAGSFDGVYTGSRTILRTTNGPCNPSLTHVSVVVRNNHFDRGWGRIVLSIDVANDGTFRQSGVHYNLHTAGIDYVASIKGKIAGGDFEADIGDNYCTVHLSLKKS